MTSLQNSIAKRLFVLVLFCLCAAPLLAAEDDTAAGGPHTVLTEIGDLAALGRDAREAGVPILLMFASEECPYCERLEAEVLGPMKVAGEDPRRVLLRKVMLETPATLRDFQGREITAGELAEAKNISFVPTLYLLDDEGRELVPKILGYTSPDFYPAYLDQAIDAARMLMRQGDAP